RKDHRQMAQPPHPLAALALAHPSSGDPRPHHPPAAQHRIPPRQPRRLNRMIAKRIVGAGRMRAGIAILGLIGLAVVACGGDTESATEVFAFEAIAADGPTIEPDPSGGFVTLTVTTNIDAVCAVAYGQTEDLGSLATDQDMGAAGHSDHEVVLGGLEPDT